METVFRKESLRDLLKDFTQVEIAAALYEFYGETGNFDCYYESIRRCFSNDSKKLWLYCDVIHLEKTLGNHEPFFAEAEYLGYERPVLKPETQDVLTQEKLKKQIQEHEDELKKLRRQTEILAGHKMPVTITKHSRFSAGI